MYLKIGLIQSDYAEVPYTMSRLNLLMGIRSASGESRLALRSFAPKMSGSLSTSRGKLNNLSRIEINGSQSYSDHFDRAINSESVTSKHGRDECGLLSENHDFNPHIPYHNSSHSNKYLSYDMSNIEKYFFNMARRPPSGGAGFDPLITPVWAGVKLPG